jgi:hypothetical protein
MKPKEKKMKKIIMLLGLLGVLTGTQAHATVRVRGHYRGNGTYVQPHMRTNPDNSRQNNWSTSPNVNPYTGAFGTRRIPVESNWLPAQPRVQGYPDRSPRSGLSDSGFGSGRENAIRSRPNNWLIADQDDE